MNGFGGLGFRHNIKPLLDMQVLNTFVRFGNV
jgi:hypothetical protein